jgi:glutaredoxin 3|tara:strand:+ start:121 stop:381 length:261 start_codon:yes stop_codon:yes gene_type:complete
MKKVKIYTTPYCPFCIRIKNLMKKKQTSFKEIDLSINPEKFEEMLAKTNGARTVPQMFVNDTHIGDCDHVHELDNNGELDKILGIL